MDSTPRSQIRPWPADQDARRAAMTASGLFPRLTLLAFLSRDSAVRREVSGLTSAQKPSPGQFLRAGQANPIDAQCCSPAPQLDGQIHFSLTVVTYKRTISPAGLHALDMANLLR